MSVATAIAQLLAPLSQAMSGPRAMQHLLADLGIETELDQAAASAVADLLPVAEAIEELLDQAAADAPALDLAAAAAEVVASTFTAISALSSVRPADLTALPAQLVDPATWSQLAQDLPDYLVVRWLEDYQPTIHAVLDLLGLLATTWRDDPLVEPRRAIDWNGIQTLVDDPAAHLAEVYGWGARLRHARLLERLGALCSSLGWRSSVRAVRPVLAQAYWPGGPPTDLRELQVPLYEGTTRDGSAWLELGVLVLPIPEGAGSVPRSLLVTNELVGEATGAVELADGWTLELAGGADASGAIGVVFTPDGPRLASSAAAIGAELVLSGASSDPEKPWRLLGDTGTRLELSSVALRIALAGSTSSPELSVGADTSLRIVISPGDGDSFLSDVLGASELALENDLSVSWSSIDGFRIAGGTALELAIPVGEQLGPIRVDTLYVTLGLAPTGVSTSVAVTGGLELGPLAFVVDRIGLSAAASPRPAGDTRGTAGPLDLALGFLPPIGLGLAIDAPPISGGGYLYHDADAGEYAGVAQLSMVGVGITAIGMLGTKLPDGTPGWSLFLSLSATFTGLQLGFGFTLNGLGGLIGVNRGLDADALGDGVRTGALDAILFPDDPIADAPQILAELDAIFPKSPGQYVFGPIAKIGWGTPTLVEVDLGIVLQLPDPLTVSLLGSLSAVLPAKEAPIVVLGVDVQGTLDVTAGTLSIDASLRDSRVLALALTGDMAVRASFLEDPTFLVAVGGFHPDFTPPASFPSLRRLGVALDTGDDLRIQLGGYFALTSNTVQFGAELTLWASGLGFTAEGGTSFDALIQFSPFHFRIDLHVWVTISALGKDILAVDLAANLEGPNPWIVAGKASFKICGLKKSLDVSATFGARAADPPPPAIDVAALLVAELGRADAWSALGPAGDPDPVVLAPRTVDLCELHPAGRLRVAQRVVPLAIELEHYGTSQISGARSYDLEAARIGGVILDAAAREPVDEWFAAAQYFELTRQEKLSSPSFERMTAGYALGDAGTSSATPRAFTCDHELVYRDPAVRSADRERIRTVTPSAADALSRAISSSLALSERTKARAPRSTKQASPFAVTPPTYVAVDTRAGTVATSASRSFFAARAAAPAGTVVVAAFEPELLK